MLLAMFAMVVLTTCVAIVTLVTRFKSVQSGAVKLGYYRLMQADSVPEKVVKTTRCVNNLFEVPVLFYVVCTLYISLNVQSSLAITLAWLFVLFRSGQALVHLTYNNVLHRMVWFWLGFGCVLLLWLVLVFTTQAAMN